MALRTSGFTLLELVASVSVVGILAGIAIPAVRDAAEATRSGAATGALLASWMASVSHAANTGAEVVLCPGDAGGCRATTDWSHGWIAFADLDGDRTRSAGETLLREAPALGGEVHLRSTVGRTRVVFQPNGGNAGSNVTWTLCDGRGPDAAITLVLANDGRLRKGAPSAGAAGACMLAM